MTNCRSKIDDTNLCKIYILALLAVCIGAIMFFRGGGGEDFFQSGGKTSILTWKESQLILTSAGNKEIEDNTALPVNLRPIFFRPIPFNDAGYDLLLTIPGIGPKTAAEMIEKRSEFGKFERAEELVVIRGIGARKAGFLKKYLTFE